MSAPFPGLPEPIPAPVLTVVQACEHFTTHLASLIGQLAEIDLSADDLDHLNQAPTRTAAVLAALPTATGRRP
ncbi:hypothetical protein [Planobispora rosea]|uniref:hypothetical protein n=1 Tax=Planobispora rosea TaxID=35762 RepID=UPI00114D00D0|nr:hypothetical protein [Planobispora rosea]